MTDANTLPRSSPKWIRPVAILAMIFGIMTVFSGGSVLFGPEEARLAAGNYMPFMVWFNFLAGFAYFTAGLGIWLRQSWALGLAVFIAATTCLMALGFGYLVLRGDAFETRTIGALALRIGVWVAISMALARAKSRS
jgi:hypothetical protein